jgi:hypothetical protein
MGALTDAAAAALAAKKAAEDAVVTAARQALNQAATNALSAVLTYKDATGATVTKTMTELGLTRTHRDLTPAVGDTPASGVVVWSADGVHLAAQLNREGNWVVRMVEGSGASWTPRLSRDGQPIRIRDLADIGAALAG